MVRLKHSCLDRENLLEAVPNRIHQILTDDGIQFAEQPCNRNTA